MNFQKALERVWSTTHTTADWGLEHLAGLVEAAEGPAAVVFVFLTVPRQLGLATASARSLGKLCGFVDVAAEKKSCT